MSIKDLPLPTSLGYSELNFKIALTRAIIVIQKKSKKCRLKLKQSLTQIEIL